MYSVGKTVQVTLSLLPPRMHVIEARMLLRIGIVDDPGVHLAEPWEEGGCCIIQLLNL